MAPTLRARKPAAATSATPVSTAAAPKATAASKPATTKAKAAASGKAASKKTASSAAKGKTAAAAKAKAPPKTVSKKAATTSGAKAATKPKANAATKPQDATKAKPQLSATAVLDHKVYPHIFDLIVSHAPHASLLALRATSHTLLERVDARLAQHIILRPGLPPPKGKKWERTAGFLPRGPPKARPRQHRTNVSSIGGALPGWVCDLNHVNNWAEDVCSPQCAELRSRWSEYFAEDTKILDVHPWLHSGDFHRAKDLFPALDTVRFYPYTNQRLKVQPPNWVVFTSFTPADPKDWDRITCTPSTYLDSGYEVQRFVFNVLYDTRRPTLNECWIGVPTQFGDWSWPEAVVILEPEPGSPDEPNPEWNTEQPRQNGVLWDVANTLRVGRMTRWIIVGASEAPHQICGLPARPGRTHAEFASEVTENVVEWIREDYRGRYNPEVLSEEREGQIRSLLRFMTVAEYRAEVGEAQWAIDALRTQRE